MGGKKGKYKECPFPADSNEYKAWTHKWRLEHEPAYKQKLQEDMRNRYLAKREMYLERSRQQKLKEKELRRLSREGDVEAKARVEKLNFAARKINWDKGKCLPKTEWLAVQAAVNYALAPVRKELELAHNREWERKRKINLVEQALSGNQDAQATLAHEARLNREKQQRWLNRQVQKAAEGDREAAHNLWKLTPEGKQWRENQIANGLGTAVKDKLNA